MKLPPAQQDLLDDIAETSRGVLYVRHYGRYGRTVRALARRGLVEITEPDHSTLRMDGWSLTAAGREHLDSL